MYARRSERIIILKKSDSVGSSLIPHIKRATVWVPHLFPTLKERQCGFLTYSPQCYFRQRLHERDFICNRVVFSLHYTDRVRWRNRVDSKMLPKKAAFSKLYGFSCRANSETTPREKKGGGGGEVLGSIFAGYVPLASLFYG